LTIPEQLKPQFQALHPREQVRLLVMLKYGRSAFGPLTSKGEALFKLLKGSAKAGTC